jgi:drug/metabolite transporter (DMT)-like permease
MQENKSVDAGYLFAIITLLIWSSFVVVSRYGSKGTLNPFDIAALRIGTAALVLSPWWLPRLLHPEKRKLTLIQSVTFAMLAGIGYPLVAYTGFIFAPASHGAVLISGMLPFFTSVLAIFLLRERPSHVRLAGLALIMTGVGTLLVNSMSAGASGKNVILGDAVLLAASVLWSLFTVLLKYWKVRAFDVTLGVSAVSAIIYLPIYLLLLPKHIATAPPQDILLQAVFQGMVVVCVAMWTYARAGELLGTVRVVIMMSAVPVVGALLAVPVLGEALTGGVALGVGITFLGALIGAMARPARRLER